MKCDELVESRASETEIRTYLADGDMTAITLLIPKNQKDATAEEARDRGMSLNAFARMSMMEELAGRS